MKLLRISFVVFFFLPLFATGQQLSHMTSLSSVIEETSGLIFLNGKPITHNDSGGEAALYEFDTINGSIIRTVYVNNAINIDWEDICCDSTHIFIGDFGNNNGKRQDLKIYKVAISDYINTQNDSVDAEIISFSYADQTDFSSNSNTNFDAEALICYHDTLLIFTKNWGNNRTNIYPLPKDTGTYSLQRTDSLNVNGLITGGTFNYLSGMIFLSGYANYIPFIVELSNLSALEFSNASLNRYTVMPPIGSSTQIESIVFIDSATYLLTGEENVIQTSALYKLVSSPGIGMIDLTTDDTVIYPNPASNKVIVDCESLSSLRLLDQNGKLISSTNESFIDVNKLSPGTYIIQIENTNKTVTSKKLIIE